MDQAEISALNRAVIEGEPCLCVLVGDGQRWWRVEYAQPGARARLKAHLAAAARVPAWLSWMVPVHDGTSVPWVSRRLWRSAISALIVSKNPVAVQRLGYRVTPVKMP